MKNIEMEATCFAALTHKAGIRAAIVCVTFLDRLEGDQVETVFFWHRLEIFAKKLRDMIETKRILNAAVP